MNDPSKVVVGGAAGRDVVLQPCHGRKAFDAAFGRPWNVPARYL